MKYLTPLVFVALAVLLTYQESPQGVLNTVRQDFKERGIDPYIYGEHIEQQSLRPGLYAIALGMGSLARNINIVINTQEWRKMTMRQKKAVIAHELTHCIGIDKLHCYNRKCVMSGGNIRKWNEISYEDMLDELIKHHYVKRK